ncbi:hypothetical protein RN01_16670 [Cupriavidus sp. SHE]|uniref:hypothetical protein n=1 Tax=Cupriavidus sp. SHE TaxID=1539143 RepID=UPI0004B03382|nr:hypothetical protein [Cupriavidus sp. SHE]KWR81178.1 hypothetical protein RN01_16670 [Cupriavidus sp. SHE]
MALIFALDAVLLMLLGLSVDWFHLYALVWSFGMDPAMFIRACIGAAVTAFLLSVLSHRAGRAW